MTEVTEGAYRHRIPEGETAPHSIDGEWCACAPRVIQLPLAIAEREGFLKIVQHAPFASRRAGRPA